MTRQGLRIAWVIFLLAGVCTSCTALTIDSASTDVTLLRLKPTIPPRSILAAEFKGILQIRNGCIYIVDKRSKSGTLLLWPEEFQLWRQNGKVVGIQDTQSGRTVKLGQITTLMGGDVKSISASELLVPVPAACKGSMAYVSFDNP